MQSLPEPLKGRLMIGAARHVKNFEQHGTFVFSSLALIRTGHFLGVCLCLCFNSRLHLRRSSANSRSSRSSSRTFDCTFSSFVFSKSLTSRQASRWCSRSSKSCLISVKEKPKPCSCTDKAQPNYVIIAIEPEASHCARSFGKQGAALIKANGIHGECCQLRHFSDLHADCSIRNLGHVERIHSGV